MVNDERLMNPEESALANRVELSGAGTVIIQ